MKKLWIILIGVVAFTVILGIGAAAGGAATYFLLREDTPMVLAFSGEVDSDGGVIISSVAESSPAADAGVVRGDILLKIGTEEVNTLADIWDVIQDFDPGNSVKLTVLHGDDVRTLTAALDEREERAYLGISTCIWPTSGDELFEGRSFGHLREIELNTRVGAVITRVVNDSPAERAGLEVGDTILGVNGDEIGSETGLADLIEKYKPQEIVKLDLLRGKDEMEIEVELGENPETSGQAYLGVYYELSTTGILFDKDGEEHFFFDDFPGIPFGPSDENSEMPFFHDELPDMRRFENLPEGIDRAIIIGEVVKDTPADEAGLQVEDLIIKVDGEPVEALESFISNIQAHEPGEKVKLTIYRDGEETEFEVILGEHPDNPDNGYLGVMVSGFVRISIKGKTPGDFEYDLEKEFKLPGGDA